MIWDKSYIKISDISKKERKNTSIHSWMNPYMDSCKYAHKEKKEEKKNTYSFKHKH